MKNLGIIVSLCVLLPIVAILVALGVICYLKQRKLKETPLPVSQKKQEPVTHQSNEVSYNISGLVRKEIPVRVNSIKDTSPRNSIKDTSPS